LVIPSHYHVQTIHFSPKENHFSYTFRQKKIKFCTPFVPVLFYSRELERGYVGYAQSLPRPNHTLFAEKESIFLHFSLKKNQILYTFCPCTLLFKKARKRICWLYPVINTSKPYTFCQKRINFPTLFAEKKSNFVHLLSLYSSMHES
jgi:hypothetical protein